MDRTLSFADGQLTIDLEALVENYRAAAARVAPAICGGVVKADAYGLGVAHVAPALAQAGCRDFFVALTGEAVATKPHLPTDARLFVLNGPAPGAEAACADLGAIPMLNTRAQAVRWAMIAEARGIVLDAALQFDTGMSRLGLSLEDARFLRADPGFMRHVRPVLLLSHLACADHNGDAANAAQRRAFEEAGSLFPGVARSLANSGATFLEDDFHFDLVRTGIALYGGLASDRRDAAVCPVVSLRARVVQIRAVAAGTAVGYGLTHVAKADARWATLGVGYADGWPRNLGGRASAWLGDVALPIIGRVSMDSMTIDISALADDALGEGDWVDLIGPHQTIDDVAARAGTISYEILTGLGHRFRRSYRCGPALSRSLAA